VLIKFSLQQALAGNFDCKKKKEKEKKKLM
jgi:hypothetical protein